MLQNMDSRACLPIRPACPHEPEHLTLVIDFCKKWWTRIATKEMAFIGIVTLAASLVASWLKQFPGFSLFGALIIALLIGMVAQFPIRKWYSSRSAEHKAGVKDAAGLISNKLLRLGIILLGFKLNLTVLFTQGIKCLPIAAVVVTLTIVVCYNIARKLGVDPQLAILVAGGTGICGAAAVMGLSGSIKVPPEKEDEKANNEVMAVAIIAIMGTIFALLEIALGPLTGLSKTQLGITAGASLHEIAHAVAAGDAFGAVGIATIMKLSRVLMLVFAAIIIAVWWDKNHSEMPADGKRKVSFPWFMLGFIGASIIGTLVECATAYDGNRETPEKSLATFKKHGYADLAPIQIMDMGGEIEIPVAKHRHIAYDIVGKHIDDYDSIFVLSHFKGHPMGGFGGALKNVSIGIASSNGKRWIHSAGVTKDKWVETPQDAFLESMAEADEAVISHMHGKMMYLNVMNRLSVDCDCLPSPTEPDMHDIGVLSSLDPVALDQACVDLIHTAPDGASVTERIASLHGEHILEYAEELGIGSRAYRLTVLD